MVTVNPFRGLRFDPDVIGDPGRVLVPPYDSITPRARSTFEACSGYNMVRLILDPAGRYDHAAKLLRSWVDEGALRPEGTASLYVYEQASAPGRMGGCADRGVGGSAGPGAGPGAKPGTEPERKPGTRGEGSGAASGEGSGGRRLQRGLLASVPLDSSRTWILPHERTMPGPVADRLRLLTATRANLSPIFGLYAGQGASVQLLDASTTGEPVIDCVDESGTRHRLWPVADPVLIAAWRALLADRQVLIADGHHRYQTSLEYRAAWHARHPGAKLGPADEVLMFLADADAEGPSILPMHRLLARVGPDELLRATADLFDAGRLAGGPEAATAALDRLPGDQPAFALHGSDGTWLLTARDPGGLAARVGGARGGGSTDADGPRANRALLDVDVLHELVLSGRLGVADDAAVGYQVDRDLATRQVAEGRYQSLVVLRPVPFPVVLDIARAGGTLPPKTTWFSPKPRDGLVLRPFDGGDG
jgi:uncharacterized protein (DUF1015 family)